MGGKPKIPKPDTQPRYTESAQLTWLKKLLDRFIPQIFLPIDPIHPLYSSFDPPRQPSQVEEIPARIYTELSSILMRTQLLLNTRGKRPDSRHFAGTSAIMAILFLSFVTGCGGGSPSTTNVVAQVLVTPTTLSMSAGDVVTRHPECRELCKQCRCHDFYFQFNQYRHCHRISRRPGLRRRLGFNLCGLQRHGCLGQADLGYGNHHCYRRRRYQRTS